MTMLMRWNPLLPTSTVRDDFDHLFDNLWSHGRRGLRNDGWLPAADLHETTDAYVVRMDLPGVAPKDVKVTLLGDTLSIRAERKLEGSSQGDTVHWRERTSGIYERTFQLTAPVRGDQVRATYRDGVLEIHVTKAEEAKPREIEVKVG